MLLWTWKDLEGEVRAAATLRRQVSAPVDKTNATETPEEERRRDLGGVITAPPAESACAGRRLSPVAGVSNLSEPIRACLP